MEQMTLFDLDTAAQHDRSGEGMIDRIHHGMAEHILPQLDSDSVDLIITSPPYADQRRRTYGGIPPDQYVAWFLPIAAELKRVLKPSGSFILNIKERVVNGERHTYVLELILEMRKQGWLWTEEYCWHKKNCYPGKWPNRFRDAWERLLHFTRQPKFAMYQDAVLVPAGGWVAKRLHSLSESEGRESNERKDPDRPMREMVYPTNVLYMPPESGGKRHGATFPRALAAWFIALFTQPGDVLLDPFIGSGTTAVAAKRLGRHYIGIERDRAFCAIAEDRLAEAGQVQ